METMIFSEYTFLSEFTLFIIIIIIIIIVIIILLHTILQQKQSYLHH